MRAWRERGGGAFGPAGAASPAGAAAIALVWKLEVSESPKKVQAMAVGFSGIASCSNCTTRMPSARTGCDAHGQAVRHLDRLFGDALYAATMR